MWPVSWGHQCCESPAAFACVVVMCVVGWEGSDEERSCRSTPPKPLRDFFPTRSRFIDFFCATRYKRSE